MKRAMPGINNTQTQHSCSVCSYIGHCQKKTYEDEE